MGNKNTVIDAKIGNLNELTKVLSVKEQAQEQLLVVMKALGIGKIVRNLKFEKTQGYTLTSLFISLLIMRLWGKTIASATSNHFHGLCATDIGLRTALLGIKDMDAGHILENVVYLELIRRGYEVSVGKLVKSGKNIEVDFVAKKSGGLVEYYQVALNVLEPQILQRELAPLEAIDDNYPKFLLSMDYGSGENNGIKRLNVFDWLLEGKQN